MATQFYAQPSAASVPPGWHPPYSGAPPIPPGFNVKPQQWQSGHWSFNPAYNAQPTQSQVPWAAGSAWRRTQPHISVPHPPPPQQQQQQTFNPYKRVPKPPSAEYLATELSDNPLGLSDMIPAEQYYASQNQNDRDEVETPQTPWIWNPSLDDEPDSNSQQYPDRQREAKSTSSSRHKSRHSSEPAPSSHSQGRASRSSRHATSPPPDIYAKPSGIGSSYTLYSNPDSANRDTPPPYDRPRDPSFYRRRSVDSGPQIVHPHDTAPRSSLQEEVFTSKKELKPTFSPNIVRIPSHYISNHTRTNSTSADSQLSHLSSRMERLQTSSAPPLVRHSSLPQSMMEPSSSSSITDTEQVAEPMALLSPLSFNTPHIGSSRLITRHATVPVVPSLSAIPESSYRPEPHYPVDPPYRTPSRGPSRAGSRASSRPASLPTSQQPSPATSATSSTGRHVATPPSGSYTHNPLPPPPVDVSQGIMRRGRPKPYKSRVRKGFWNRRGDHFTQTGHIVYAPPDRAHPRELKHYPDEMEGYLDDQGWFLPYNENRPELLDSLPRQGRPPKYPYDTFIHYEHVPK
ncbi:hypothetical protein BDN72DRAFT_888856 [Pluteus cervinus]|uniref:Uncharacterized protein n=1 Tax=Pluteus cervinus TaxID=181527 RepID=A0ACD3ARM3_9AGAR|nr:hypothetical protein BDN72DRAFT_888856 [Pluteus cervinus]